MRKSAPIALMMTAVAVAACAPSPEQFETPPVEVQTEKGVVTCQLYTREITAWDRSIGRPNSMSVQEGDSICKAEGERRKKA
jgi:hypothetical protein